MLTRRSFVAGSTIFVGLGTFGCRSHPRNRRKDPNEEVRVAVVGVRGRGHGHVQSFIDIPNVRVVAICDVDRDILAKRAAEYEAAGHPVDTYVDLRAVLDRSDVDAVSIATPNHLHALQSIWTCQAGKDVYVEKPVSHNIWEGRQIVRAAREYGRIVTTGTQCRSSEAIEEALAWTRAGGLGEIQLARGLCYKPRKSIGKVDGPQEPPAGVDYDLWTGPAPLRPLMRENLHYDWHWVFDTGNGDVGNQGIHQMDLARWALGEPGLPRAVTSVGGRFGYDDDGDTPNTQIVLLEYERAPVLFEVRGLPRDAAAQRDSWNGAGMDQYRGARIGLVVHCTDGHLLVPSYDAAIAYDTDGEEIRRWEGASNHFAHFVDLVRSRSERDQRSNIEEGHVSSAMCHLGNVSHALGEPTDASEIAGRLPESPWMREAWTRMRAHLAANGLEADGVRPILGPRLTFDAARERFAEPAANALLARDYREPFVVPEKV